MASEAEVLNYAIENSKNVLLIGKHGVGKTALVKEAFERHGLSWKYFSASTIDPWVDLVGVPKEKIDKNGNSYLELVRPKDIEFDDIEAIFLDEYNRSPKKVRNAVMELIQFGSINGKKMGKLRIVFAAINPDDDEDMSYDVDKLDPAQLDRFHIHLPMDYKPSKIYFKSKYGALGVCAVKWWNDQTKEVKELVSPRRLEYAVEVHKTKGSVRYVFDAKKVNVKSFLEYMEQGDPIEVLDDLLTRTGPEIRKFFSEHNSFNHVREELFSKVTYVEKLAKYVPEEELMTKMKPKQRGNKLITYMADHPEEFEHLRSNVLRNQSAYNPRIVDAFKKSQPNSGQLVREKRKGSGTVEVRGEKITLSRMNACFTGSLDGYTREQAGNILRQHGAQVSTSMTAIGVTHAIVGVDAGNKRRQADQKGITILSEADFESIVSQLSGASLSKLTTMAEIGGRQVDLNELTIDNYMEKTGIRFRMTKEQSEREDHGEITRQDAFDEFINSLRS